MWVWNLCIGGFEGVVPAITRTDREHQRQSTEGERKRTQPKAGTAVLREQAAYRAGGRDIRGFRIEAGLILAAHVSAFQRPSHP